MIGSIRPSWVSATILSILSVIVIIFCSHLYAHDAFYPHHKQDFQELQPNRGKIIFITAIFFTLLTVGIAFGLWKGDLSLNEDVKALQGRLQKYSIESAKRAIPFLKVQPAEALRVSVRTYAQISGVPWQEAKSESDTYVSSLSCKIADDFLKAKIFRKGDVVNLELTATCDEAGVKVVMSETGEIQYSAISKK